MLYEWITLPDGTSIHRQVIEQQPEPKPEPAGHVCDVCGKTFTTKLALSGHKRSH